MEFLALPDFGNSTDILGEEIASATISEYVPQGPVARKRQRLADGHRTEPVRALGLLSELSPSKQCIHRLFHTTKSTVESIAELRGIQVSTVYSYLTDAIRAGYAMF